MCGHEPRAPLSLSAAVSRRHAATATTTTVTPPPSPVATTTVATQSPRLRRLLNEDALPTTTTGNTTTTSETPPHHHNHNHYEDSRTRHRRCHLPIADTSSYLLCSRYEYSPSPPVSPPPHHPPPAPSDRSRSRSNGSSGNRRRRSRSRSRSRGRSPLGSAAPPVKTPPHMSAPPHHQPPPAHHLTTRLLQALDTDYNVVDMRAIYEVISVLENINITKELLEATRLGKHVNELRRRTDDAALARRTKLLVKRWRDLVIPEKAGSKPVAQPTSAESTPRQSPLANRGISPAVTPSVTPRLCSPQVSTHTSLSNVHNKDNSIKSLPHLKRQPLTSPALHNLSPGLRNSQSMRNSSPNFKNVTTGHKSITSGVRSMSPAIKNISPRLKNSTPDFSVISPALRMNSQTIWNVTPSKDPYDSDSQDVIFVDDNVEDVKPLENNSNNIIYKEQKEKSSNKRPRSPVNGGPEEPILADEFRHEAKKAQRESGGRKAKKRRNHTKSENRTVDHSIEPSYVGSPFLPISSASTSPALSTSGGSLRNGLKSSTPVVSVIIDDLDSRSSASASDSKSKSSRKNGCKKPSIEVDNYSNFIKNKIPVGGRKVKTTKELLDEMQARKSGKIPLVSTTTEKKRIPKKDFLTTYDSKKQLKKETVILSDIIELNDSNSSSKPESATIKLDDEDKKKDIKSETDKKSENNGQPAAKFEPVDVILSRLPPINKKWREEEDFDAFCTCTMIYDNPEPEVKVEAPAETKKSIFELDIEDPSKAKDNTVSVPVVQTYEEKIDPNCPAGSRKQTVEITEQHVNALHNLYIPDVNGSSCENDSKTQKRTQLACRTSSWGLRPYYDCSRDLFHTVVPKYNYLDYSLDRCVKNLSNVTLDRYEPAEVAADSTERCLSLENEFFEKWKAKSESLKCDDYLSAADSPFSEKCHDERDTNAESGEDSDNNVCDSVIKSNVIIDRDDGLTDVKVEPEQKSEETSKDVADSKKDNDDEELPVDKERNMCDFWNFTGYGLITNSHFSKKIYPRELLVDCVDDIAVNDKENVVQNQVKPIENLQHTEVEQRMEVEDEESKIYEKFVPYVPRSHRKLTYEDEITLLPLSLSALNSDSRAENSGDLSCLFRTKCVSEDANHQRDDDQNNAREACDLSYSLVQGASVVEMGDVACSARKRTRGVVFSDHDEDANCDSDVKRPGLAEDGWSTNGGAFVSDDSEVEKCVKNGCPSWIPGSVPPDSFREWHEPVQRTSHNEELLTILPYVVID